MSQYFPIAIVQSDGKATVTINGKEVPNEPDKADQAEDKPVGQEIYSYYKKIGEDDDKAIEWKVKLGALFSQTLGGPPDRNYILKEIPAGYTIWQNFKQEKKLDEKGQEKLVKRSDSFMYGYPIPGKFPRKYKSPGDFFNHLLWLAMDATRDRGNCPCKFCCPDESPSSSQKLEGSGSRDLPATGKKEAADPQSKVAESNVKGSAVTSSEQKFDSDPNNPYLYRPGELVWFNKGQAWGLAIICKREISNQRPRYTLQPLSHPLRHPSPQIVTQDNLRPWLAWSVPLTTHKEIANMAYDQVPWEQVLAGQFGPGDAEVDGSILAAKQIDRSYTLFGQTNKSSSGNGETFYTGMFLGAEKIWTGEPVRIRTPNDDVAVMIIHQINEKLSDSTSSTILRGDIYKFVENLNSFGTANEHTQPNLPPRMVADLLFRNETAQKAKRGSSFEWTLIGAGAERSLEDVKGRWYETRTLLPILRGQEQFQQEIAQGNVSDAGLWMNARGDNNSAGQRMKSRNDALGRAVPAHTKIGFGSDGPVVKH